MIAKRPKIRSSKFEIDSTEPSINSGPELVEGLVAGRNNNKILIFQFSKHVSDFGHLIFGFVWYFDIQISDLE